MTRQVTLDPLNLDTISLALQGELTAAILKRNDCAAEDDLEGVRRWAVKVQQVRRALQALEAAPVDPYEPMLRQREVQIAQLRRTVRSHIALWGDEAELRAVDVLACLDQPAEVHA